MSERTNPSGPLSLRRQVRQLLREAMSRERLRKTCRRLTHAGFAPPWLWKRLPVEAEFEILLTDERSFRYVSTAGDAIGRALFWRGIQDWESETIRIFYRLARDARCVIDIGANSGVFSLVACAANPALRVIAFEPVPQIFRRLQTNISLNNWQDRCKLHCLAVSDVEGRTGFHIPYSEHPTSASLHPDGFRGVHGEFVEVEVTTIDAVLSPREPVDLVKIDVEGFEDRVLKGMRRTLHDHRPSLVFECNFDGPTAEIARILHDFEYHVFHLRAQGPVPVNTLIPDPKGEYRNFLATADGMIGGEL